VNITIIRRDTGKRRTINNVDDVMPIMRFLLSMDIFYVAPDADRVLSNVEIYRSIGYVVFIHYCDDLSVD